MSMRVLGSLVVLGLVAASCSSDASKKQTPPASDNAGGEAGDTNEGGASAGSAGATPSGGDGGSSGEGGTPSEDGGAMPGGGTSGGGGSGGSAPSVMTDGYLSGTRLRAILESVGTAQRFVGWHDSMLDIDCDFQVDSAGVPRCLPSFSAGNVGYSDVDCKQPIVVYEASATPSAYVADPGYLFTCGMGPHFLSVGTVISATGIHIKDDAGMCGPASVIGSGQIVHQLGAVVPDTAFVSATKTETEARDTRLTATVRVASDGSRQVTSFYDLSRKAECNPLELSPGAWSCVPDARAYIEYFFTDATCTVPAAFHPGYAQQVCGFTPQIVENSGPDFTNAYYEVGAQIVAPVHDKNGPNCPVYTADASLLASFYSVGAAVPKSAFAPFALTNEGTGRIQLQTLRNPEGGVMSHEAFYDSSLGFPCSRVIAADLVSRCLPSTPYSLNLFSDSLCKQGLYQSPTGTPPPADLVYLGSLQTNGGQATFKLGPKTTAPAKIYDLNGLDCVELGVSPSVDYYSTTIVQPSELVAVTQKAE